MNTDSRADAVEGIPGLTTWQRLRRVAVYVLIAVAFGSVPTDAYAQTGSSAAGTSLGALVRGEFSPGLIIAEAGPIFGVVAGIVIVLTVGPKYALKLTKWLRGAVR